MKWPGVEKGRGRIGLILLIATSGLLSPATAFASTMDTTSLVAYYTAVATGCVLAISVVLAMGLKLVHGLGFIGDTRQISLRRSLRVVFGATFLMAAVTPYVALNFSMTFLLPFIAAAGLIITAWAWGATKVQLIELDADGEVP